MKKAYLRLNLIYQGLFCALLVDHMRLVFFLVIGLFAIPAGWGANLGASYDADTYYFTQTYNEVRTGSLNSGTFHVGQHFLATNPTYDGHFNFGAVLFNDLSSFSAAGPKILSLNVKDFKTPAAVVPGYQGPPLYNYLSTGNFRLAVVALTADFTETAITADLPGWYQTHLFSRPRIAQVDVTTSGIFQIDVTGAVNSWISAPQTNFGFGLIGVASTPEASTLRLYSMESAGNFGPVLIPEPGSSALFSVGIGLFLMFRRRARA